MDSYIPLLGICYWRAMFAFKETFISTFIVLEISIGLSTAIVQDGGNPLENQIEILLNRWRQGDNQNNLFPLPSLKTFNILPIQNYYEGTGIKINFSIDGMNLTGLDTFSLENLKVTEYEKYLDVDIGIRIPKLKIYADKYILKGRAYYLYSITGKGNMTIISINNTASLKLRFGIVPGADGVQLDNFVFDFDVENIQGKLEQCSWPVNEVINTKGVDILKSFHDNIIYAMWNYVVPPINGYLSKLTPQQFLTEIANINADI